VAPITSGWPASNDGAAGLTTVAEPRRIEKSRERNRERIRDERNLAIPYYDQKAGRRPVPLKRLSGRAKRFAAAYYPVVEAIIRRIPSTTVNAIDLLSEAAWILYLSSEEFSAIEDRVGKGQSINKLSMRIIDRLRSFSKAEKSWRAPLSEYFDDLGSGEPELDDYWDNWDNPTHHAPIRDFQSAGRGRNVKINPIATEERRGEIDALLAVAQKLPPEQQYIVARDLDLCTCPYCEEGENRGHSRRIAEALGVHRTTVSRYRQEALGMFRANLDHEQFKGYLWKPRYGWRYVQRNGVALAIPKQSPGNGRYWLDVFVSGLNQDILRREPISAFEGASRPGVVHILGGDLFTDAFASILGKSTPLPIPLPPLTCSIIREASSWDLGDDTEPDRVVRTVSEAAIKYHAWLSAGGRTPGSKYRFEPGPTSERATCGRCCCQNCRADGSMLSVRDHGRRLRQLPRSEINHSISIRGRELEDRLLDLIGERTKPVRQSAVREMGIVAAFSI
jgi:hypothetical protein